MNDLTARMSRIDSGPRQLNATATRLVAAETLDAATALMWRCLARRLVDRYADMLPPFRPGPHWLRPLTEWLIALGNRDDADAQALIHAGARGGTLAPVQALADVLIERETGEEMPCD